MTVSMPLIFVLGLLVWFAIKFLGVRVWIAVVIALFGFWLSRTVMAEPIESGTRTGVGIVNR
ncbi:hypothetical protein AB0G73_22645 [Streptomyces sp. NPDC020719]|uniref:hypothetical protein n=1 Tax=Streptomyces sp. NPDC020719 TaxID=3154896 RepID=UPI0033CD4FF7